jgi:hypothetical protein
MFDNDMKSLAKRSFFAVLVAICHAVVLYAIMILGFIGSIGAPQGGDAGHVYPTSGPVVVFLRVLQTVMWILFFPASLFTDKGISPLVLWVCNSLIWGIAIVAIMNRIVENKKTNHCIEPTRDTPAAGQ